ncbi:MAG: diguanylate cyclase, partial [Sulfitobacter sp.]|nr:diguanylate cyclase [Sulfitobacter sp.]
MALNKPAVLTRLRRQMTILMLGPPALASLPAISLSAYWFGGEGALIVFAALLPVLYLVGGSFHDRLTLQREAVKGVLQRNAFEELTEEIYARTSQSGREAAAFFILIDDFDQLIERHGQAAADTVVQRTGERLRSVLRGDDNIGQMGDARFAICTEPVRHLDLELCIQMASRMQTAAEEPISVDGTSVFVSVCVGFCQYSRAPGKSGAEWLQAGATALREAHRRGPSAIRAFSDQMRHDTETQAELREDVAQALDSGQIQPWFQPQISTDTGQITGFEALARWTHPDRGLLSPAVFLPAIE